MSKSPQRAGVRVHQESTTTVRSIERKLTQHIVELRAEFAEALQKLCAKVNNQQGELLRVKDSVENLCVSGISPSKSGIAALPSPNGWRSEMEELRLQINMWKAEITIWKADVVSQVTTLTSKITPGCAVNSPEVNSNVVSDKLKRMEQRQLQLQQMLSQQEGLLAETSQFLGRDCEDSEAWFSTPCDTSLTMENNNNSESGTWLRIEEMPLLTGSSGCRSSSLEGVYERESPRLRRSLFSHCMLQLVHHPNHCSNKGGLLLPLSLLLAMQQIMIIAFSEVTKMVSSHKHFRDQPVIMLLVSVVSLFLNALAVALQSAKVMRTACTQEHSSMLIKVIAIFAWFVQVTLMPGVLLTRVSQLIAYSTSVMDIVLPTLVVAFLLDIDELMYSICLTSAQKIPHQKPVGKMQKSAKDPSWHLQVLMAFDFLYMLTVFALLKFELASLHGYLFESRWFFCFGIRGMVHHFADDAAISTLKRKMCKFPMTFLVQGIFGCAWYFTLRTLLCPAHSDSNLWHNGFS